MLVFRLCDLSPRVPWECGKKGPGRLLHCLTILNLLNTLGFFVCLFLTEDPVLCKPAVEVTDLNHQDSGSCPPSTSSPCFWSLCLLSAGAAGRLTGSPTASPETPWHQAVVRLLGEEKQPQLQRHCGLVVRFQIYNFMSQWYDTPALILINYKCLRRWGLEDSPLRIWEENCSFLLLPLPDRQYSSADTESFPAWNPSLWGMGPGLTQKSDSVSLTWQTYSKPLL